MGTDNTVKSLTDLLENSFWAEWSDDEGIGSDVSLDHSDLSSSDGASNVQESPDNDKKFTKTPRRNISVKKIVKILRRSVGSNDSQLSEVGATVSEFQHQKVFGVDLTEHLEQTSTVVPKILEFCCEVIEQNGVTDGVYRLSGQSSHIVTLKREFEGGKVPDKAHKNDVHAVASLIKLYFRSLPEPLLTFELYSKFLQAAQLSLRYQLSSLRRLVYMLPKPHLNTLTPLMKHLQKLTQFHKLTGMTSRNLAIVWAPNLLRPSSQDCLRDCGVQALVIEALIVYYKEIFETDSDYMDEPPREFTKEVSIDQAVARAESFKPKVERRMMRSISCISNVRDLERRPVFQGRGVQLRRDRSLTYDAARNQASYAEKQRAQTDNSNCSNNTKELDSAEVVSESINLSINQNRTNFDDDSESIEHKNQRIRSSRSRLKERLNWFSSRSRQRLSSFGSSDNLRHMRDGLMRSRDKLSCALSPVRGRMGSYQLSEVGSEGLDEGNVSVRVGKWQ
jgi:hypothetical protein